MPCRVPKRRFSCGAPQHLTKNLKKDRRKCDGLLKTQLFSVQLFIASAAFLSIFLRLSEEFFSLIREGFSQGCITNFALQEVFEFIEVRSLAVEEEGLLSLFLQFRIITVVAPVTAINGCLCFELGVTHATFDTVLMHGA